MRKPSPSPTSLSTSPLPVLTDAPRAMTTEVLAEVCERRPIGCRRSASKATVREARKRRNAPERSAESPCISLGLQSSTTQPPPVASRPSLSQKLPPPLLRSEAGMLQDGGTHFGEPLQRRLSSYYNYYDNAPDVFTKDVGGDVPDYLEPVLLTRRQLCNGVMKCVNGARTIAAAEQPREDGSGAQLTDGCDSAHLALGSANISGAVANVLHTIGVARQEAHPPPQWTVLEGALWRGIEGVDEEQRRPPAETTVSLEELSRPAAERGPELLRVAISNVISADLASSLRARDQHPPAFPISMMNVETEGKAVIECGRREDSAQPVTALQVMVGELIVTEIAARKELWISFVVARYELLMMELGFKSCDDAISAPPHGTQAFDSTLGTISLLIQYYADMSLEGSRMWMGDLYLDLYKAPAPSKQPAPHQRASAFVVVPTPIAARRFISALAEPASTSPAPFATATATPCSTVRPQALVAVSKQRLPTFQSFLHQCSRGLTNPMSASNAMIFTAPFAVQIRLRVLQEFAVIPPTGCPQGVNTASVSIRYPSSTLVSSTATALGAAPDDAVSTGRVSTRSERSEALVPARKTTVPLTLMEDVSPQDPEPSLPTAFQSLRRRWSHGGEGAAKPPLCSAAAAAVTKVASIHSPKPSVAYAASLVTLKQLSRLLRDEAAFHTVDDSLASSRHLRPLCRITFERVRAEVQLLMLWQELYASVRAAAASHFGFAERLRASRELGAAASLGKALLQRIVSECAQEAADLHAAVLELSCHARESWLHHVQGVFLAIMPPSHTRPCILASETITAPQSPFASVLVHPRQLTSRSPTRPLTTCLYMERLCHLSRDMDDTPLPAFLSGDLIAVHSISAAAPTVTAVMAIQVPYSALGHLQLLTARENPCSLPPCASSSLPISGELSTPLQRRDSVKGAHAVCPSAQISCSSVLMTGRAGSSSSINFLETARGCRPIIDARFGPRQEAQVFQAPPFFSAMPVTPPSVGCCPGEATHHLHDTSRPVAVPLKARPARRYTGRPAKWDITMLLRSEAYARAFATKQECCEAQLLKAWRTDSLQSLEASAHFVRTVTRVHHLGSVQHMCDQLRRFWERMCMEKQLLVDRWVREREDLQLEFYAGAVVRHRSVVQRGCLAERTEEYQSLDRNAREHQTAGFSVCKRRSISA
ncbi:hypothetical protein LSCM1_03148 [Leishmania martiniquensis]|uniref:Uncharacterized protein n=1 Tax=Leishmania martiniquensis TaxID=1580590 RepID=A0A836KQE4_9TRYP|nr:hypothetical protein LSCM1_03148 [Leishmania martiniquensis]